MTSGQGSPEQPLEILGWRGTTSGQSANTRVTLDDGSTVGKVILTFVRYGHISLTLLSPPAKLDPLS